VDGFSDFILMEENNQKASGFPRFISLKENDHKTSP
jgi:hypothetical protein